MSKPEILNNIQGGNLQIPNSLEHEWDLELGVCLGFRTRKLGVLPISVSLWQTTGENHAARGTTGPGF